MRFAFFLDSSFSAASAAFFSAAFGTFSFSGFLAAFAAVFASALESSALGFSAFSAALGFACLAVFFLVAELFFSEASSATPSLFSLICSASGFFDFYRCCRIEKEFYVKGIGLEEFTGGFLFPWFPTTGGEVKEEEDADDEPHSLGGS